MTRDELIETMARAVSNHACKALGSDKTWDTASESDRNELRPAFEAALTAIESAGYAVVPRNPTVEMRVAGGQMMVNVYSGGVYSYGRVPANDGQPGDVGTIYRAMIAAATEK